MGAWEIMDKLDDFLKYSVLFSYYGELFPKKKKQYLELYLEENSFKKGVKKLDENESKLRIFEKERELKKKLEYLKENFTKENLEKILEDFEYTE